MAKPRLKITLAVHGNPISGRCFGCNENLEKDQPLGAKDVHDAFRLHVEQKHSRQDVNQAASRIEQNA
jgi:hypothetical protein